MKQAIVSSYPQHLGIDNYEVLESERGGRLSLAKEQFPDGASLVEGICKCKAMLYIRPKHSEGESDEELPSAASILGKRTPETVIDLSDDDVETSADQLKSVFPVIHPISFYSSQSSGLEESRRSREEQDAEYNAMLENDLALENQDSAEEKTHLKSILNDSFDCDGYRIRMRLPGETTANLQCSFGTDVTTKNLYQYAFAFSNIQGSFLIYTTSPRIAVPCSELVLADGGLGHVFAVEEDENGIDPDALFVVPTSESSEVNVEGNDTEQNNGKHRKQDSL